MVTVIPKRNFLVRQEMKDDQLKDIVAKKGERIMLSEQEAIKFWGSLDIKETDKKKLMAVSKAQKIGRIV